MSIKISVVIPVKNGRETLDQCLAAIKAQSIRNIEIIILDSDSKDNSKEIALSYGAKIIDVPPGTFNHGLTRNIGANLASGNFLFYSVQDAQLAENGMLERMVNHFQDETVMGVVGHQAIPWGDADKNPAYWFKRYSEPEINERYFPEDHFKVLTQNQQFAQSGWDNVVAMYRRSALISTPFKETNFAEDWIWANVALKAGYKLLSDPSVVVYHYHHLDFGYRFKTQFTVNYHFYKHFNQLPAVPLSPLKFMRATYTIIKRKAVPLVKKPYWIVHNMGINLADFFSNLSFRALLFLGGNKLLDWGHEFFCSKVPQGKLKKRFES